MAGKGGKEKAKEHDSHELIIIKRHEDEEHEAHNSAWKVAHADFMTAMMAFFLIMWLINVTDEETKKGISAYFNPLHLTAAQKGLNGGDKPPNGTQAAKGSDDPEVNKKDGSSGTSGAPEPATEKGVEGQAAAKGGDGPAGGGRVRASVAVGKTGRDMVGFDKPGGGGLTKLAIVDGKPSDGDEREQAAVRDPYGMLDKLAAAYTSTRPVGSETMIGDDRLPGLAGGPAQRDPFDPLYWQVATGKSNKPEQKGTGEAKKVVAAEAAVAVTALETPAGQPPPPLSAPASDPVPPTPATAAAAKPAPDKQAADPAEATHALATALDTQVQKLIAPDLGNSPAPQVKVEATKDGVVISLTDGADFSMFDVGSAIPNGKVVFILGRIGDLLARQPGPIIIRGFTDARPFHSDLYDNWRLSAERAHMAYYMLVRGGLDERRVSKIEGFADRSLKNSKDPNAAENRRIEILLEGAKS